MLRVINSSRPTISSSTLSDPDTAVPKSSVISDDWSDDDNPFPVVAILCSGRSQRWLDRLKLLAAEQLPKAILLFGPPEEMETNVKINQLINDRSICREDFFFSYFLLLLWPLKINRILYFQPRLWRKTLRRPARCLLKLSVEPDGSILSSWARPSVVVYSDRSAKVLSYRLLEERWAHQQ